MKKFLSLSLLSLFIASCATTQSKRPDPYAHVSVENIKINCQPTENWRVGVLGMPAYVLRFNNCLKVKTLLIASVDTENLTEKIRRSSMDLLALHYVEYLKRNDEAEGVKRNWYIKKITT